MLRFSEDASEGDLAASTADAARLEVPVPSFSSYSSRDECMLLLLLPPRSNEGLSRSFLRESGPPRPSCFGDGRCRSKTPSTGACSRSAAAACKSSACTSGNSSRNKEIHQQHREGKRGKHGSVPTRVKTDQHSPKTRRRRVPPISLPAPMPTLRMERLRHRSFR